MNGSKLVKVESFDACQTILEKFKENIINNLNFQSLDGLSITETLESLGIIHGSLGNYDYLASTIYGAMMGLHDQLKTMYEDFDDIFVLLKNIMPENITAFTGNALDLSNITIETGQIEEYEDVSLESLDKFTDELINKASQEQMKLVDLFIDEKNEQLLRDILENTNYLSTDTKELLLKSDKIGVAVLQKLFGITPDQLELDNSTKVNAENLTEMDGAVSGVAEINGINAVQEENLIEMENGEVQAIEDNKDDSMIEEAYLGEVHKSDDVFINDEVSVGAGGEIKQEQLDDLTENGGNQ